MIKIIWHVDEISDFNLYYSTVYVVKVIDKTEDNIVKVPWFRVTFVDKVEKDVNGHNVQGNLGIIIYVGEVTENVRKDNNKKD